MQKDKPFTLSGLKGTIEGFSKRYKQHDKENTLGGVSFTIIANRKIAESFKTNIEKIIKEDVVSKQFIQTLKKYTKLSGKKLIEFCSLLNLEDGEGDYNVQKEDLRVEMTHLQPGIIDPSQLDSIVSMVQERVLPNSDGKIVKEHVLKPFRVTSEKELFPAPPLFEKVDKLTIRDVYSELIDEINKSNQPVIIHAEGGVGKSVFSQYAIQALPEGSLGISYDCFGSGKYRSRSEHRHKHREALVQIANELASLGFCDPMLVNNTTQEDMIMRGFLSRVASTLKVLKQSKTTAQLFILIDAADNAEMAASEFSDSCFANELLREQFPKDCHVVLLCRPERIHLLKPPGGIPQISLPPFSTEETYENLKKWFPAASEEEGSEFHRLTNGNPRVQMNSIAAGHTSVKELLSYLGPFGTTVEKQIEIQLESAVQKVKDATTVEYQNQVDKISTGLASLPPNIPIEVLAKASGVQEEDVRSFVADIGRSLWSLDSSVQFRDEPTETWFRKTYLATEDHFAQYIKVLEPLAAKLTYVAEVLPQLYLQAGMYDQLIEMALSEQLLPEHNPIDKRNVMVYRLQFAFKAALRSQKYEDAIKLALRAGEEVAGDRRQQDLFQANTDILPLLQDKSKVQEIAFKRVLRSGWEGSENVYTASLLSGIAEYKGEASGYLRSAMNWLMIHIEQVKKADDQIRENKVEHRDIIEIAFAHLNLFGAGKCLKFLNSLQPKEFIFKDMKGLVNRLIDAGRFEEIEEILKSARRSKFYVVAIVSELVEVGRFPEAENLEKCLDTLTNPKQRIKKPSDTYHDNLTPSIVAFLEACLHRKLSHGKILQALDYYVPKQATIGVGATYDSRERVVFLKALAIRNILSKKSAMDLDAMIPERYKSDDKKRRFTEEIKEFKEVVGSLIPWYTFRISLISGENQKFIDHAAQVTSQSKKAHGGRYRSHDILPIEIAEIISSILIYCTHIESPAIKKFYQGYLSDNSSFNIQHRINVLRAGSRSSHLDPILPEIENSTYHRIKELNDVGPEEIADHYISLARTVLLEAPDDAAVYFEEAIDIVSKFGDEIVERWEAVVSLGRQAGRKATDEIAYRFIRCAELVGGYVAREKHWNRSDAVITCAKMSPPIAISTLSRWRDREIGRFHYQIEDLLIYLVKSRTVNPTLAWSMTRLFGDHVSDSLLTACLKNEDDERHQKEIFDDAVSLLRMEGVNPDYWVQLKAIGDEYEVKSDELNSVVSATSSNSKPAIHNHPSKRATDKSETKKEAQKWTRVFNDIDILKTGGLAKVHQRFLQEFSDNEDDRFWRVSDLYSKTLEQIKPNQIHDLIDELLDFEKISQYDFEQVLSSIPDAWKNKVSFKKKWPTVLYRFGVKYAHRLASTYSFRSVVQTHAIDGELVNKLKEGVFYGLSQGQELTDASTLFGFVRHAASFVNADIASDLTHYALSRFELHIEDDFGDGPWGKWLHVSSDINNNIAGFIWSALGSPLSETRWRACHTVKKLADFGCTKVLNSLIEWMEHDLVEAYGSNQYPFYNLHARQYLLIALCRVSIDNPEILVDYKEKFQKHSQFESHVLIQKFSSEIALNIEKATPGTYSSGEISSFEDVGKSKHEVRKKEYGYRTDSYLHQSGEVDTDIDRHFGWDFDEYWYKPLGEVFGIPGKQVQDLCAEVIVKEWGLGTKSGYNNDPRVGLWNRSQDRKTWHDHGSYPKTDNLDFYLSYHSMLVVAAKLVENMPVISSRDYWDEEDPWDYWLSRHSLTRIDGKWLSDSRGKLPLERPDWITKENKDELWRTDIQEIDFLKSIKVRNGEETWLNIKGGWTEKHNSRYETQTVSSSLVSKETSIALMRALATTSDYHDYKLPDFEEDRVEIDSGIFKLRGFIFNPYVSKGIDEFDPYAGSISYPPFSLGEPFNKELNLSPDVNGLKWFANDGQIVLECDIWSSEPRVYDEEPEQSGMRLSASLPLLKRLCQIYDSNLIIDVNISRDIEYKYRSDEEKYKYLTHNNIYLFTPDGRLRSISKNYRLR
ncbi:MAG: hypothetical protein RLN88_08420 [Ekhidna sp.]|uniref:hypothetical protein n=1 Tax=Ekhidna sp. TaxID=2608089 RepID=UPI0032F078AF